MPTTPLIAYAHVGKTFDGGRVLAVDDVSLEVAEGEFLAIVGGSGSGKTTLLRLANRLIEADAGSITVEGEDVRSVDPILLRRRIGYVFQSGGLFPHLTVADNIGITPRLTGAAPAAGFSSPAATLSSVDFPHPVGPTMATNSPCATDTRAFSTAV